MEESVNFVKGYGKVNPSDDEPPHFHHQNDTQKRRIAVAVCLIVLLTVVISAMVAALIYESINEQSESSSLFHSSKPAESIKAVCSVTPYPDSCFTSISSVNTNKKLDPVIIFTLSLQVAVNEQVNLSSLPKALISKSTHPGTVSALRDCATLFDDALTQLKNSVELMRVGPGEKMLLTEEKIGDVKTWISAAMTDDETCLDGLQEMESTAVDEVRMKLQGSKENKSNSLAILANIHILLDKFGLTMH